MNAALILIGPHAVPALGVADRESAHDESSLHTLATYHGG